MTNFIKSDESAKPILPEPVEGVPDDFLRATTLVSLSGAMPKLALVEVDGRFYPEGGTPEDIRAQWEMCEDLAHQGVAYCLRKMAEGVVSSEALALERLYKGLQGKDWCSTEQKTWIVRRAAAIQHWSVPALIPMV